MSWRDRPRLLLAESSDTGELAHALDAWYEVVPVRADRAAVSLASSLAPDVVLLETSLPELDAVAVLVQLLGSPDTEQIPILLLADPYDDADAVRCLDVGATDYFARGITHRELLSRLDKAVRESRHRSRLAELARTDPLTGLANYRALMDRAFEELNRARRYAYPLAAVMVDLDNLKAINDRYGHDAGNRALLNLTSTLRATLRQTDFAARYGGDEFVVLLPHHTPAEAAVVLERVRRILAGTQLTGASGEILPTTLTVSAGIAAHDPSEPRHDYEALLKLADAALHEAKREGRDRVVVCDADLASAFEGGV